MPQRNTSINGRAVEIPVSIAEVERENSLNAVSQSGGHAAPLGRQPQTNAVPFKIAVEAGPPEATADAPRCAFKRLLAQHRCFSCLPDPSQTVVLFSRVYVSFAGF